MLRQKERQNIIMRNFYKYLVYISLIVLLITLYKSNYLFIPRIYSLTSFFGSLFFLFVGFIALVASWKFTLIESNYHTDMRNCMSAVGLSVFTKYIPGKIWVTVGKAAYHAKTQNYLLGQLSALAVNAQLISLWVGLVLGIAGIFSIKQAIRVWWLLLAFWIMLTLTIFTRIGHDSLESVVRRISRKKINIPSLGFQSVMKVFPWFLLYWSFWSIGFWQFVRGLSESAIPPSVALAFPLAATLGLLSLITPGGLGAREGVLVVYLKLAGVPLPEATTIALCARLWFLIGEVFIFLLGLLVHQKGKMSKTRILV